MVAAFVDGFQGYQSPGLGWFGVGRALQIDESLFEVVIQQLHRIWVSVAGIHAFQLTSFIPVDFIMHVSEL